MPYLQDAHADYSGSEEILTSTPLIQHNNFANKAPYLASSDAPFGHDDPPAYESNIDLHRSASSSHIGWRKWTFNVPQQPHNPGRLSGWKPATLRAPVLGPFVLFSILIIALLEILSHISRRPENGNKGLAFAIDVNNLSPLAVFGYSYFPTILAVCYSMIWSWVDLDIKRLEPWFQLSKGEGVAAEDSLLLQYPFDFLPFIPVSAIHRRHWGVFYGGLITLMIFYVITPMQSSIFNTDTVIRSAVLTMGTNTTLIPLVEQAQKLNLNFMEAAYGVAWLGQSVPSYSTNDLAFLPFQPVQESVVPLTNEQWITTAEAFYTNLTCTEAEVIWKVPYYTFSDGKGCVVPYMGFDFTETTVTNVEASYVVAYIGYWDDAHNDWSLQNPNCSIQHSHNFLAVFAPAASVTDEGNYNNLTALFCETTYSTQTMHVTVNASNRAIHEYSPADENATMIELTDILNITNFEYLIGNGVPATSLTKRYDFQDEAILRQQARFQNSGIVYPNTNMVGFAAGLTDVPIKYWSDPAILQQVFQNAHQLLLVSAFGVLTQNSGNLTNLRTGVRQDSPGAVILARSICIIVEVALGAVAIFTLCLWYICQKRPSKLTSDPASIADIMSMVKCDGEMSDDLHDSNGRLNSVQLDAILAGRKYRLDSLQDAMPRLSPMSQRLKRLTLSASSRPDSILENRDFSGVRSIELKLPIGFLFISLLLGAMVGILFIEVWASEHNGIRLPSSNTIIRAIIENYAPTAFATLVEPTWGLLNRLLCVLQPFEELRNGNSLASRSLKAQYTSLPPQLAVWRALRAKHLLLSAVCIVAVSTNVLAVALSALLVEGLTTTEIPFQSTTMFVPSFNLTYGAYGPFNLGDGYYGNADPFYVLLSNMSHGNILPPWIDQATMYLPVDLPIDTTSKSPESTLQAFKASTIGFGANMTCTELSSSSPTDKLSFNVSSSGFDIEFKATHFLTDGTAMDCFITGNCGNNDPAVTCNAQFYTNGSTAMEAAQQMNSPVNDGGFCSSTTVFGWVRVSNGTTIPDVNATQPELRNVTQTFLSCKPQLLVAQYDVTVDTSGHIIGSNRTSDFATDLETYFAFNNSLGNINETHLWIQASANFFQLGTSLGWHNDSFTSEWFNSLLTIVLDSHELVDPSLPVPDPNFIIPHAEALYAKFFAVLLGLNQATFARSPSPVPATVYGIYAETRIFVSPLMFKLCIIILSIQLIVAILFYVKRPKRFLPRMPTSIASIMAFVVSSRALEDFNGENTSLIESDKKPKDGTVEQRYGYGRFVGTDGRTKVGIEKQRYVVPLEVKNPHVKRRRWGWRFGRRDEKEVKTWI